MGLRLTRPILEHLIGGAAYRFSLSRVDDLEVDDPAEEDPDLRLGALGPFLELDTRDDLFIPSRGVRARVFGEVGGPYLGGEIHFLHGGVSASHYVQLGKRTVLAGTAATEWIVPIAATDLIPIQERLLSGGENSGVSSSRNWDRATRMATPWAVRSGTSCRRSFARGSWASSRRRSSSTTETWPAGRRSRSETFARR